MIFGQGTSAKSLRVCIETWQSCFPYDLKEMAQGCELVAIGSHRCEVIRPKQSDAVLRVVKQSAR